MRICETRTVALPGDPDAAELSYLEVDGGGAPFVLLHGLTGHRDDFVRVLPALAEGNDLRWLAPDLRGHGDFTRTGRAEDYGFGPLVRDVAGFADALGLDRFHLLGHSFGGMVALRFVLAHPERVDSLVLMNTAPVSPEGYDRELFEKIGAIAVSKGMTFLQERIEQAARAEPSPGPSTVQTHKWADVYWSHHELRITSMDPVAYGALGIAMVEQEPVVGRLGEIQCPTTILVGDDDTEFLRGADLLEAGIPHAIRFTLHDSGHHPHMESREPWLAAIQDHIARCQAG